MATWQQGINSGGFLGGIGQVNTNAPQASDVNATLGMIRQNNDFARAGGNNIGLQALQGLGGLADAYKQNQQAERQKAFQQEYGNAFKSGDRSAMRDLAAKYPDQFENVQKGMGFIDDDHRTTMGNLAMNAQLAAGQGPEAFGSFLKSNATELNRIGVNPADVGQTYQQNPQGASDLFGNLAMFSLGPKGYLDALDKREGRVIDRDKVAVDRERLAETARNNDMENARGWASVNNAALDRAQRAQFHSDDMGVKLMELGQKGKPTADLIKGLNSDITGFGKNYNAVKSAANSLQALSKVNTGAAQLGIIFNYMKSLDPQSVVREGEQVQVMRSDGVWGQMKGYVDQLNAGNGLSQDARNNIVQAAKINANSMGEQFNQQVDEYLGTYGDTIPQGLKNSLSSRKAKLFEDVPKSGGSGNAGKPVAGSISEGATATNPSTGQKIIYRGGQWQPM